MAAGFTLQVIERRALQVKMTKIVQKNIHYLKNIALVINVNLLLYRIRRV